MKQLLQQYSAYNIWANEIITGEIIHLPPSILYKEMNSSFATIYKTIVHLMDVESIWWQRLNLNKNVEWPGVNYNETVEVLSKDLLTYSEQWNAWVHSADEVNLSHVFE